MGITGTITKNRRGFTLIELLVVMGISIILMGLVLYPVLQSFGLTRRAQAMVDAQDAARVAMEQISRELGQAMYVYDNANAPVDLPVPDSGGANGVGWRELSFAKIDFVLPKTVMHCNNPDHPSGQPRDFSRSQTDPDGRVYLLAEPPCPFCESANEDPNQVEARPKLPLEQEDTVVRYFLGLNDNKLGRRSDDTINSGWISPWGRNVEDGTENQVVLYRVEFSPYDESLFGRRPSGNAAAVQQWVQDNLADPRFFYKEGFEEAWARQARVVGIGKYEDLVIGTFDADDIVSVEPTITFRTTAVDNDTFAGAFSDEVAHEYPDAVPTLYKAAYGYWTPGYRVIAYRDDPSTAVQDPYEVAYATGVDPDSQHLLIYKWTRNGGDWQQTPHFDITQYAMSGTLAGMNNNPLEMAFTVDPNRGAVSFALRPPVPGGRRSISDLNPVLMDGAFHSRYATDRATAARYAILATSDPDSDTFIENSRIVPGSERVIGPDMTPRHIDDAVRFVRYERVPLALGDPGLNQYKINYDTGEIYFSSVYDQDLYRWGGEPSNAPPIQVDYDIYFNNREDVVKGDYATKSLVTIHLGMRMFDPESSKAHPVDLTKSVKVRNALR